MLSWTVAPEKLAVASSGAFCFAFEGLEGVALTARQSEPAQRMLFGELFNSLTENQNGVARQAIEIAALKSHSKYFIFNILI